MKTGTLIRLGLALAAAAAFLPMAATADGRPTTAADTPAATGWWMYSAILHKDLATLKACLAEGKANLYCYMEDAPLDYRTPLPLCAKQRWMEGLQCLVEAGADVNRIINYDTTALAAGIDAKWPEGVDYLLSHGADPNLTPNDGQGAAPLLRAVWSDRNGHIVRALLAAGADPHAHAVSNLEDTEAPDNTTLVHDGDLVKAEVLEILLEAGARDGRLLGLQWFDSKADAAQKAVIAKWQDSSPLMKAALAGDTPQMQALLAEGADAAFADNGGVTPLMYAAGSGKADGVELLLKAGAKVQPADMNKDTALHYAAAKGCAEAARHLLAAGADANATDVDGWTPLAVAIFKGNAPVVEALLQGGADADLPLWDGTPCRELAFGPGTHQADPILLFRESAPDWGEGTFAPRYPYIWCAESPDIQRMLLKPDTNRPSDDEPRRPEGVIESHRE